MPETLPKVFFPNSRYNPDRGYEYRQGVYSGLAEADEKSEREAVSGGRGRYRAPPKKGAGTNRTTGHLMREMQRPAVKRARVRPTAYLGRRSGGVFPRSALKYVLGQKTDAVRHPSFRYSCGLRPEGLNLGCRFDRPRASLRGTLLRRGRFSSNASGSCFSTRPTPRGDLLTSTRKPDTAMPVAFLDRLLRGVIVLIAPPRSAARDNRVKASRGPRSTCEASDAQ